MDKIIIQGGRKLAGEVPVSGAKNAALPILVSALLTEGTNTFRNIPNLVDIKTARRLLHNLGVRTEGNGTVRVDATGMTSCEAPYDGKTMRGRFWPGHCGGSGRVPARDAPWGRPVNRISSPEEMGRSRLKGYLTPGPALGGARSISISPRDGNGAS